MLFFSLDWRYKSNMIKQNLISTLTVALFISPVMIMSASSTVLAQDDYDEEYDQTYGTDEENEDDGSIENHRVAVTLSPIHLFIAEHTTFELTGELRLGNKGGIGAIIGAGIGEATVIDLGGHGRYYLFGRFDNGMHVGVEGLIVTAPKSSIFFGSDSDEPVTTLNFAGLIGYKYTAPFGLTAEAQLGYYVEVFSTASLSDDRSSSRSSDGEETGSGPVFNFGLGWAF